MSKRRLFMLFVVASLLASFANAHAAPVAKQVCYKVKVAAIVYKDGKATQTHLWMTRCFTEKEKK